MALPPALEHQLGEEEQAAHRAVLALFEAARSLLPQLAKPVDGSKASAHLLEKQVQAQLSKLRTAIRDLELLAEEQDTKAEKTILEGLLQQHRNAYAKLRNDITVAQRTAMQTTFQVYEKQRQELLSGAAIPALLRKPGTESEMVSTAADITAGLRRAKMALAEQIQHTEGNTTLLENNTDTLTDVNTELTGQKDLLKEGKKGLKTVERQASGDKWLICLFFCIFLAAAGYVGFKRAPPVVKVPITSAISFATRGIAMTAKSALGGASWFVKKTQNLAGKGTHDEDDDELPQEYMYRHDLDERIRDMDEQIRLKRQEAKHRQHHQPPHHRQRPDHESDEHDQPPQATYNEAEGTAQIPYKRPGVAEGDQLIFGGQDDSLLFGEAGYAADGRSMDEQIKAYVGEEHEPGMSEDFAADHEEESAYQHMDIPSSPHLSSGIISAEEKEELLRRQQEHHPGTAHQHRALPPEADTYPDGYGHAAASGVAEAAESVEEPSTPPSPTVDEVPVVDEVHKQDVDTDVERHVVSGANAAGESQGHSPVADPASTHHISAKNTADITHDAPADAAPEAHVVEEEPKLDTAHQPASDSGSLSSFSTSPESRQPADENPSLTDHHHGIPSEDFTTQSSEANVEVDDGRDAPHEDDVSQERSEEAEIEYIYLDQSEESQRSDASQLDEDLNIVAPDHVPHIDDLASPAGDDKHVHVVPVHVPTSEHVLPEAAPAAVTLSIPDTGPASPTQAPGQSQDADKQASYSGTDDAGFVRDAAQEAGSVEEREVHDETAAARRDPVHDETAPARFDEEQQPETQQHGEVVSSSPVAATDASINVGESTGAPATTHAHDGLAVESADADKTTGPAAADSHHTQPVDVDATSAALTAEAAHIPDLGVDAEPVAIVAETQLSSDDKTTPSKEDGATHIVESVQQHELAADTQAEIAADSAGNAESQSLTSTDAALSSVDVPVDDVAHIATGPAVRPRQLQSEQQYTDVADDSAAALATQNVKEAVNAVDSTPEASSQHAQHDALDSAVNVDTRVNSASESDVTTGSAQADRAARIDEVTTSASTEAEVVTAEELSGTPAAIEASFEHEHASVPARHLLESEDDTDLYGFNSLKGTDVGDNSAAEQSAVVSPVVHTHNETVASGDAADVNILIVDQHSEASQEIASSPETVAVEPIGITLNATNTTEDDLVVLVPEVLDVDDIVPSTDASSFQVYDEGRVNASVTDMSHHDRVNATSSAASSNEAQAQDSPSVPSQPAKSESELHTEDTELHTEDTERAAVNEAGVVADTPVNSADAGQVAVDSGNQASAGNASQTTPGNAAAPSSASSKGSSDDEDDEYDDELGDDDESGDFNVYGGGAYEGGPPEVMEMPIVEEEEDEYADPDDDHEK